MSRLKIKQKHFMGLKLLEFDIQYSPKLLGGLVFLPINLEEEVERLYQEFLKAYPPGKRKRSALISFPSMSYYFKFRTEKELREEIKEGLKGHLAEIKINPEKYTMVLPTHAGVRDLSYESYSKYAQLENKLERKKEDKLWLEEVRTWKNLYSFLYNHPELYVYTVKWHEMGHMLAFSKKLFGDPSKLFTYDIKWRKRGHLLVHPKNLFGDLSEGVAMLYEFKGLLLGAQEEKFKIDEVKEMMRHSRTNYLLLEKYKRAFERVLKDFNLEFKSLEEALQDVERRINRYVEREGNI